MRTQSTNSLLQLVLSLLLLLLLLLPFQWIFEWSRLRVPRKQKQQQQQGVMITSASRVTLLKFSSAASSPLFLPLRQLLTAVHALLAAALLLETQPKDQGPVPQRRGTCVQTAASYTAATDTSSRNGPCHPQPLLHQHSPLQQRSCRASRSAATCGVSVAAEANAAEFAVWGER